MSFGHLSKSVNSSQRLPQSPTSFSQSRVHESRGNTATVSWDLRVVEQNASDLRKPGRRKRNAPIIIFKIPPGS